MTKYIDALDGLLDRPIAFNPSFKQITGSTNAALLLSQAFYWTKRTNNEDGWFYKTRDEWMEETGLTAEELDGARKKCKAVGVIEEKRKGVPATIYYRIIKPRVYELLGFQIQENPQSGLSDLPQSGGNPESGSYADFNKESENTAGTTSENINNQMATALFKTYFGKFYGTKEQARWEVIYEAVGNSAAEKLAEWAFKKEIHLINRGGLLDSLETAAKKWNQPKGPNHANRKSDTPKRSQPSPEQDAANQAAAAEILAERAARQATRV